MVTFICAIPQTPFLLYRILNIEHLLNLFFERLNRMKSNERKKKTKWCTWFYIGKAQRYELISSGLILGRTFQCSYMNLCHRSNSRCAKQKPQKCNNCISQEPSMANDQLDATHFQLKPRSNHKMSKRNSNHIVRNWYRTIHMNRFFIPFPFACGGLIDSSSPK